MSSIIATATLDRIDADEPRGLWFRFKTAIGITRKELDAYFYGVDMGYALHLRDVTLLPVPIGLAEMRTHAGLEPPQSFRYVSSQQTSLLTGSNTGLLTI